MKDYVAENERILNEWRNHLNQYEYFAPDGIMYKGEFRGEYKYYEGDKYKFRWVRIPGGRENNLWENAPLRLIFLTKDQNASGDTAWDVRSETYWAADENITPNDRRLDTYSKFNKNLVYILYGILNTTTIRPIDYNDITNKDALSFVDDSNCIFARINCKKEVGKEKCDPFVLKKAIDRDKKFLKQQILNLDADIFLCCGYDKSIKPTGSHILNFLNEIGYNFEQDSKEETGEWIFYDKKTNKVAINSYHPSYSGFDYNGLIAAYSKFLNNHPNFTKSHRK